MNKSNHSSEKNRSRHNSFEIDELSNSEDGPGGGGINIHQHQYTTNIAGIDPRAGIDHASSSVPGPEYGLGDPLLDIGSDNFHENENYTHRVETPTWRRPVSSTRQFFHELSGHFGWKFLTWLAIDQFFISGGVFALIMAVSLPLFKELGIGAARQQLYMSLMMSPWAMKPFIGVASDLFPLGGYNKKYFALYSILIGLMGCSVLVGIFHSGKVESAVSQGQSAVERLTDIVILCFTFVSYEAATLDILSEGKYSELMRIHPESGSSIISFKFVWSLLGSVVVQIFVGPLADAGYFHVLFWIALAFSITPLYPTCKGYIPEKKHTAEEPGMIKICWGNLFDNGSFQEKQAPFIVITLCGLSAPILAAVTTYGDLGIGLIVSFILLIGFCVATFFIFPPTFFRIFMAIIITSMSWISISSALSYWYTASSECNPGGPNFSYTYFITVSGIIGSVVNFFAVILYQNYLSSWRFRPVLIFTLVIGCLASIIDLTIIMRWNIAIGIPDKVYFLFGNAIIENLVIILNSIAMSSIYAKMSPPGMESAVFAYTVGIANFCGMISNLLGSAVISWSGMTTVGDDCNWANLPYLIVIFQILVPILIGVPAIFLVPNSLQTEHLIDWSSEGWYEKRQDEVVTSDENTNAHTDNPFDDSRLEPHLL